jgi:hypothetical protein
VAETGREEGGMAQQAHRPSIAPANNISGVEERIR